MFEKETDTILATARQRIPHSIFDSSTVMLKDIIAADIPHPLKSFFRADVELALAEELTTQRRSSRFNYHHPEIESLQAQMNSILVMHYAFKREEFLQRLDDAVHMMINYLVRPQWTLTNVLFETQDKISSSALMRLLKYFGPYEHIRSLLLRYIEERNVAGFTRQEFSTLLWKVDGHFLRRKTGLEAAKVLTPLYEFTAFPGHAAGNALPMKALIKYCSDKGFAGAVRLLEDESANGTPGLTQRELGDMLERLRRASGAFEVDVPPAADFDRPARTSQLAEEAAAANVQSARSGISEPAVEEHIAESESAEPVQHAPITFTWSNEPAVQPELSDAPDPVAEQSAQIEHASPTIEFDSVENVSDAPSAETAGGGESDLVVDVTPVPETMQPATPATSPSRSPAIPSLLRVISEGERKKFIKKIFLGDYDALIAALRQIDELPTWRQASVFIDEIFIKNDIDPYLPEAVRFIDIVQEKYYPRKY